MQPVLLAVLPMIVLVNLNIFEEVSHIFWEKIILYCIFQAKIAFLQGERTGQENLKRDLIRRIKMLEFALRQERLVPISKSSFYSLLL